MLALAYFFVGRAMGFHSAADYRAWIASSSHGISGGGLSRAVIGFARSFVDVGDYGRVVKRYLVKDPFNPATVRDLVSLPLAKLAGLYVVMAVLAGVATLQATGRREILLQYKDGAKKVVVPADAPIVRAVPGTRADLVVGEYVFINAQAAPDGTLRAPRIQVSKDGVRPPQ